jgi:hypothetical protein
LIGIRAPLILQVLLGFDAAAIASFSDVAGRDGATPPAREEQEPQCAHLVSHLVAPKNSATGSPPVLDAIYAGLL